MVYCGTEIFMHIVPVLYPCIPLSTFWTMQCSCSDEPLFFGIPMLFSCLFQIVTFDYGMRDRNPIDELRFYGKSNPNKPLFYRKDEASDFGFISFSLNICIAFCMLFKKRTVVFYQF